MASIVDLYKKSTPKAAKANTTGIDKTPIGIEIPSKGSKDLMKSDLSKPRHGALGQGTGGYDSVKNYSSTFKSK
jgi:hypothetical protein